MLPVFGRPGFLEGALDWGAGAVTVTVEVGAIGSAGSPGSDGVVAGAGGVEADAGGVGAAGGTISHLNEAVPLTVTSVLEPMMMVWPCRPVAAASLVMSSLPA